MSAVPDYFMEQKPERREPLRRDVVSDESSDEPSSFWSWFAIGMLLFCWVAEASMCAERGF
ncbi:MAG: hypothetical protein ABI769_05925 [Pseudomonadota bacterium]